jgi:hypothetical protein
MDLPDQELVTQLQERDGRRRSVSHTAAGPCRYAELYAESRCPWCEAEERRHEREGKTEPSARDQLPAGR